MLSIEGSLLALDVRVDGVRAMPQNTAKNNSGTPQHRRETLSMNESEVPPTVAKTAGTCRCMITATSTTALVVAQERSRQQPFPSTAPVESRRFAAQFTLSTHLCVAIGVSGTLTMNWI